MIGFLNACSLSRPDPGRALIFYLRIGAVAVLLELADVSARNERLVSGPRHDHDADAAVLGEFVQDLAKAGPHLH